MDHLNRSEPDNFCTLVLGLGQAWSLAQLITINFLYSLLVCAQTVHPRSVSSRSAELGEGCGCLQRYWISRCGCMIVAFVLYLQV
jgi:hypothetical protein